MVTKTLENAIDGRHKAVRCAVGTFLLVTVIGLLALTGTGQQAGAQTAGGWGPPVNLSVSDTASLFPDIAVDSAGHVYVVWGEHSSDDVLRPDLLLFRMWDGQTWSPPNDIAVGGHLPQIAVDSQGRLHIIRIANGLEYNRAWAQGDPSNAQAWTPGQDISTDNPYWPDMVVDSQDRIHVVFTDEGGINYTRSIDGGDSWSDPTRLDIPRIGGAETPRLAVDHLDNLYAIWSELEVSVGGKDPWGIGVSFSYSTDGGETWSPPREVVTGDEGYEWPQVAVDSVGTIHTVWRYQDPAVGTFGYMRSSDRGESWSEVENLRLGTGAYAHGLAVDSAANLHLVIPVGGGDLPMGVSHLVRPPGGQWSPPTRISQNPCNAGSADIELMISGGNHLHVVWYDRLECKSGFAPPSGRGEVFYSSFMTDAPYIPAQPIPTMPPPTIEALKSVTPTPMSAESSSTPQPTTTRSPPTATRWSPGASSAKDAQTGRWVPNPLLVGPALAGALVGVVVILKSAMIGRR